jgi:hypothetical protein
VLALAVVLLLTNQFVARRDAANAAIPEKSIAVLPLTNESGNKDEQYFSDGLSEDLITELAQFEGLTVIGRSSAFQFRDSKEDSKTIGAKTRRCDAARGQRTPCRRYGAHQCDADQRGQRTHALVPAFRSAVQGSVRASG